MKKVVVVDYDMGNLFSVQQACTNVGLETVISKSIEEIRSADALILPGVGSFNEAMANLQKFGLTAPIKETAEKKIPFLGICLGMQLLFTESEEFGNTKGLDLIKGKVVKFPSTSASGETVKIPQINWNTISYPGGSNAFNSPLLDGIAQDEFMYFVHSYYVVNDEAATVACSTEYAGVSYCSGVCKENIMAFQFHPEKSASEGLKIYSNFKNLIDNGTK